MIRRSEHPEDPWSGHMAFPGGRKDPGDTDSLGTAIRETQEEIGLTLSRAQCLGALAPVWTPPGVGDGSMVIEAFVFWQDEAIATKANNEVAGVFHFPLSLLRAGEGRGRFDYDHKGTLLKLDRIDQQGCRIWGLSLRVLDDLIQRLAALD
jgi:8-oxo-dGTP pyrophosphatase MutT (NUDIX family)